MGEAATKVMESDAEFAHLYPKCPVVWDAVQTALLKQLPTVLCSKMPSEEIVTTTAATPDWEKQESSIVQKFRLLTAA